MLRINVYIRSSTGKVTYKHILDSPKSNVIKTLTEMEYPITDCRISVNGKVLKDKEKEMSYEALKAVSPTFVSVIYAKKKKDS